MRLREPGFWPLQSQAVFALDTVDLEKGAFNPELGSFYLSVPSSSLLNHEDPLAVKEFGCKMHELGWGELG